MKKFLIVTNSRKDPELQVSKKITEYLEKQGAKCVIDAKEEEGNLDIPKGTECIIVLGGDGTLLRTAGETIESDIPLIGVNLGTLGYLAEVDSTHIEEALDKLLQNQFTKEKRMMLSGIYMPEGKKVVDVERQYALNDITITRRGSLQVVTINIYVNGMFLTTYHADGVLLATPTGSTGYNLSAGGPIVDPHAQLILLTPVCPHTLQSRTIVLSADDVIAVEIGENKKGMKQELEACFDGSKKVTLVTGDKIEIRKSSKTTEILKLSQVSFLEVLHQKMNAD